MNILKSVKVLFIVFLLATMSLSLCIAADVVGEDGLLGYWNFDHLKDGDTVFFDLSGNERHGILSEGTRVVDGKFGKALKFDGKTTYAEIPYDEGLSSPDGVTIEVWINPAPPHQAGSNGGIINNINGRPNNRLVMMNNGKPLGEISVDIPPPKIIQVDGPVIPIGIWSHIVFVCDGLNGTTTIYVNGLAGKPEKFTGKVLIADTALTLGWGHTGDNYHYSGLIDEVKIYGKVLSPKEIEAKYKQAAATK